VKPILRLVAPAVTSAIGVVSIFASPLTAVGSPGASGINITATTSAAGASNAVSVDSSNDYQTVAKVVVTAQKIKQRAIDVPMSVTAINADTLAGSGMTRLADYAAEVPGMSVTELSRGYTSVVLRGLSTGISQATPSTAFYIDDAPIGSITPYAAGSTLTPDIDPYELQRIEVLKGPQGTLYGADAIGGLVRYVTTPPSTRAFGGDVTVGANHVNDGGTGYNGELAVNVPLNQSNAVRVSAFSRTEAGYIRDPITGRTDVNSARTNGGRLDWSLKISDDWSLRVWALGQKFTTGGIGAQDVTAPSLAPLSGDLTRSTYIPETQKITLTAYNATLKGKIRNFSIVSSTTLQSIKASTQVDVSSEFEPLFALLLQIPNIGAGTLQKVDTKRWSEELRVSSSALEDALHYTAGFFYTREESTNSLPTQYPFLIPSTTPFTLAGPLANALISTNYKEYSVFLNGTYDFTPQWELEAGVRYSHDDDAYYQNYQTAILSPIPTLISQVISQNKTNYLASLRYKPTKDTAIYARVATGYRVGGPSALPPGVIAGGKQSFDPDTVTSYELGLKSVFADGKVSLDTAAFTTDWKNIQIQTSTQSATTGATYQYFVNGSTARSSGAEATLLWLPVSRLTLRATVAYTDSRLTADSPAAGGVNGDRMPFVPEWTGSLLVAYNFMPIGQLIPFVGASWNYIGSRVSNFSDHQPPNPFNLPSNKLSVPSYNTLNMNAGFDVDRLRVTVYGTNLNDSRGITFINSVGFPMPVLNPLGNPFTEGVIQPRTVGVDVSYRF